MEQLTFNKLILILNKRPLMIIGEFNIFYLWHRIAGFLDGRENKDLTQEEQDFNNHFDDFIHEYYYDVTTHNWASLLWYNEVGHKQAIEKFLILYEEFKKKYEN